MNALDTKLARLVDEALRYGKCSGKNEVGALWYLVARLGMDVPLDYFEVEADHESVGC